MPRRARRTRRAGCALGSFYTYFASKDDIFRALVNDMSGQVRDYVSPRIAQARDGIEAERIGLPMQLKPGLEARLRYERAPPPDSIVAGRLTPS